MILVLWKTRQREHGMSSSSESTSETSLHKVLPIGYLGIMQHSSIHSDFFLSPLNKSVYILSNEKPVSYPKEHAKC